MNVFARWFWPVAGLVLTIGSILFFVIFALTQKRWVSDPKKEEACVAKQKKAQELKAKGSKATTRDREKADDEAAEECYCERVLPGMIKQPVGTWTALAFCFVGMAILAHFWVERGRVSTPSRINPMTNGHFFPGFYGVVIVLMGPGAMAFHATMTWVGGWLDLVSMVLFASFVIAYDFARAIKKWTGMADWAEILVFVLLYVIHAVGLSVWLWFEKDKPNDGQATLIFILSGVIAGVIDMILVLTTLCRNRLSFWAAGRLFILALIPWLASQGLFWKCDPDAFFQWHGLWHIIVALFTGWIYIYFRTEASGRKASEWETAT